MNNYTNRYDESYPTKKVDNIIDSFQSTIKFRIKENESIITANSSISNIRIVNRADSANIYTNKNFPSLNEGLGKMIYINRNRSPIINTADIKQKWEGYVVSVKDNTFIARIIPTKGEGVKQQVEIRKTEIPLYQQESIEIGAVFYWSIGYFDTSTGRKKKSIIDFRRRLKWDIVDFQKIQSKVDKLNKLFSQDSH